MGPYPIKKHINLQWRDCYIYLDVKTLSIITMAYNLMKNLLSLQSDLIKLAEAGIMKCHIPRPIPSSYHYQKLKTEMKSNYQLSNCITHQLRILKLIIKLTAYIFHTRLFHTSKFKFIEDLLNLVDSTNSTVKICKLLSEIL